MYSWFKTIVIIAVLSLTTIVMFDRKALNQLRGRLEVVESISDLHDQKLNTLHEMAVNRAAKADKVVPKPKPRPHMIIKSPRKVQHG